MAKGKKSKGKQKGDKSQGDQGEGDIPQPEVPPQAMTPRVSILSPQTVSQPSTPIHTPEAVMASQPQQSTENPKKKKKKKQAKDDSNISETVSKVTVKEVSVPGAASGKRQSTPQLQEQQQPQQCQQSQKPQRHQMASQQQRKQEPLQQLWPQIPPHQLPQQERHHMPPQQQQHQQWQQMLPSQHQHQQQQWQHMPPEQPPHQHQCVGPQQSEQQPQQPQQRLEQPQQHLQQPQQSLQQSKRHAQQPQQRPQQPEQRPQQPEQQPQQPQQRPEQLQQPIQREQQQKRKKSQQSPKQLQNQQQQQACAKSQPQEESQQLQPKAQQPSQLSNSAEARKYLQDDKVALRTQQQLPEVPDISGRIPIRKSCGTLGRKILVETNHLALTMTKKLDSVIHYDVAFTPEKPKKLFSRIWQDFHKNYLHGVKNVVFDGTKNAYSTSLLQCGEYQDGEVEIIENGNYKPKMYKVVMKYASKVNLNIVEEYLKCGGLAPMPQEALQVLEVVLRTVPSATYVRVGRSYFGPPPSQIVLSGGLELWYGFYQSVILGWKPFLNIDVAHKSFPSEQPILDLIAELQRVSPNKVGSCDSRVVSELERIIKGLKVQYQIPGQPASKRTYRVSAIEEPANKAEFIEKGKTVAQKTTVALYFQNQKRYRLKYPFLPCLVVGPIAQHIMIPSELCTVVKGQVINRSMTEQQTRTMIKYSNTSTTTRKEKIMNTLKDLQYNKNPYIKAFGLSVSSQFEQVSARVLDPPKLEYNQREVIPSKGVWRAQSFLQAVNLSHWTILNLSKHCSEQTLENFVRILEKAGREVGMTIESPVRPFKEAFPSPENLSNIFTKCKGLQLIFVILPEQKLIYAKVKQIAELGVGCLTQCLKDKTVDRMNPATAGNILLKVNAKLNGKNHTLRASCRPRCLMRPCMIMGADITHPSPDQNTIPSVAAVCASLDAKAFSYNFRWRLQNARQEIIYDLEDIVKEHLKTFYQKTHCKPERIIFFRDGVSEGQFREVLNAEVHAIRKACKSLQQDYEPKVTFLVVQKRHHTRFFPTNPNESDDKNLNVKAGTLVDTDIVHRTCIEYYLVSHASIQGVARPTKYRVLWDDACMSQDEIQQLTYYLCHMFARCTRSVSYPAPTYYAHLAAFRARLYLEGSIINLNSLEREQNERRIKEALSSQLPMFFV